MDPVANMNEQRALARDLLRQDKMERLDEHIDRLCELVITLDAWLTSGGFNPWAAPDVVNPPGSVETPGDEPRYAITGLPFHAVRDTILALEARLEHADPRGTAREVDARMRWTRIALQQAEQVFERAQQVDRAEKVIELLEHAEFFTLGGTHHVTVEATDGGYADRPALTYTVGWVKQQCHGDGDVAVFHTPRAAAMAAVKVLYDGP